VARDGFHRHICRGEGLDHRRKGEEWIAWNSRHPKKGECSEKESRAQAVCQRLITVQENVTVEGKNFSSV